MGVIDIEARRVRRAHCEECGFEAVMDPTADPLEIDETHKRFEDHRDECWDSDAMLEWFEADVYYWHDRYEEITQLGEPFHARLTDPGPLDKDFWTDLP